jgi:hypothetical protein
MAPADRGRYGGPLVGGIFGPPIAFVLGRRESTMSAPHNQFRVQFDPKIANDQTVKSVIEAVLRRAGCPTCGRIAELRVQFVGDPGPELVKGGVTSIDES